MPKLTLLNLFRLGCYGTLVDARHFLKWHSKITILVISLWFIFAILLIEGNWYHTNYSVLTTSIKETSTYKHSNDERTTSIVNYLTGRGPLPESERLPLYRQYVKIRLEEAEMPIPANFYTLGWTEVTTLAIEWYKHEHPKYPSDTDTLRRLIEGLFESAIKPPLERYTPNVHENLWLLLSKVGSPRIRWLEEQDDDFSRWMVVYGQSDKQAFYNPINNTVYIRYKDAVNVLLDEVGHAQQFRENPLSSYRRMTFSMLTAWVGAEFDTKTAIAIYQLRYNNPDTFEGEAHGPIKEVLLRESGLIIVEETVPPKN